MIQLRVDDIDVPPSERTFWSELQARLGQDYEVLITLQESEWFPRGVIEHVHLFIQDHQIAIGVVLAYLLDTTRDVFKGWAVERLKRAPRNTEILTIFDANGRPIRKVAVRT